MKPKVSEHYWFILPIKKNSRPKNLLLVHRIEIMYLNKEDGESQTTQLILNDVIFTKLHVSTRSDHLQFSHQ
jgi:hypothetical protein